MRRNRSQHGIINQPIPLSGGGPLMTNHLRDLDIELELLKRKRDIIQQEQDMLSRGRYTSERQYDYQQPSNNDNRQEPKYNPYNYSQPYEGPSNSGNYRPQGMKRPFQGQVWQAPAKRFNGPKPNSWDYSSDQSFHSPQSKPVRFSGPPQAPRPLLKKSFQPPPQRKQFQPNKVTKPKPQVVPNKLSTYPMEKTKKLVAQTLKPANKDSEILRIDIPPSPQMKGRLELALGTIIKDMRQAHCAEKPDQEWFMAPYVQRMLKHTIRTRIHRLMLNQHVGSFNEIITTYRNKYPTETDLELIQLGRDARNLNKPPHLVWNQIDADRPDEYFKKNMTKLIHTRLEDMFLKLADMYKYSTTVNLDEYKFMFADKNENKEKENGDKNEEEPKTVEEQTENDTKKIEDILGQEDGVQIINEKLSKIKLLLKFVQEVFEQNIPKLLPKFKELLVTTLFNDKEFQSIKSTIIARCKSKLIKEMGQGAGGKPFPAKTVKSTQNTNAGDASAVEKSAEAAATQEEETKTEVAAQEEETKTEIVAQEEETKNEVVAQEEETKTEVAAQEEETKAEETPVKPQSPPVKSPMTPAKVIASEPSTPASKDILYVKLIGRPTLPARAIIYEFLNKYNPVSIKKHKSLANLLVLGFKDKENYEKVLEANETVVGESTLIIKSSEQINTNKDTPFQNKAGETPSKSMNSSLDDIITSDIDNQITDLLTTIEKTANEGDDAKTGEDNGTEDLTDTVEATKEADVNNDASETVKTNKTSDEKMDSTIVDTNLTSITEDNEDDKNNERKEPIDKAKANVKESAPGTPTRTSSRLANATPRTIATRRNSKLV